MNKGFMKMGWPLFALLLCSIVLLAERSGISYEGKQNNSISGDKAVLVFSDAVEVNKECLLIMDSSVEVSRIYSDTMSFILDSMSVGYDIIDLEKQEIPNLESYSTIVLAITDLSYLKEKVILLGNWVREGGCLMNAYTYMPGSYLQILLGKMGIIDGGTDFTSISGIKVEKGFMIGGGRSFTYNDEMEVSLRVNLDETCKVYLRAENNQTPILWEKAYGKGKFVVLNQEVHGKITRGILSSAYSLLEEAFIYPVINASAFYLDDFPAPIPEGENDNITRDYKLNIKDFYLNIWCPTILHWEKKFGIIHTGMIIEDYSDIVKAPFIRQKEVDRFKYYGNILLNNGGEIGLHGYNHMPLLLDENMYEGKFDSYTPWPDTKSMKLSLDELMSFAKELFPSQKFSVYIPPSDILSEDGREVIKKYFPDIKAIASSYITADEEAAYIQEFDIGEDGIINTPRITSGSIITGYNELATFSELNFHYVQSHFMHPDDALDVERGADLGWEELSKGFEKYLSWIYSSAPNIRNVTGSQMGQAVEKYDRLTVNRSYKDHELQINLGGFSKEAYLMLRLNEGPISTVTGGEYENITGNLYLIHALKDEVKITWSTASDKEQMKQ